LCLPGLASCKSESPVRVREHRGGDPTLIRRKFRQKAREREEGQRAGLSQSSGHRPEVLGLKQPSPLPPYPFALP
jgi:hypothetical protein